MATACAFGQEPIVSGKSSMSAALPDEPGAAAAGAANSNPDASSGNANSAAPGAARVAGTVTDANGDIVPGATVVLDGPNGSDHRTATANANAGFEFDNLKPGVPYRLTVSAQGFVAWKSDEMRMHSGDVQFVTGIRLRVLGETTSVTVTGGTQEEIATQEVHIEEQQRVLGFIPNFYVVYDAKNAVPLTAKLKFQMAYRVSVDPINILGAAFLGAVNQAADTPDYRQGWAGYGERVGAVYTDGLTDTFLGGAILPSLLHQDPRYFYQGTGTVKSRTLHALAGPFVCKGDNGQWQPNYSSIGGDLISGAISNAYYPASNRGAAVTFENLAIDTAEREVSTVIQEFVVRKLTPSAKRQN
ncbi:MAG TPA: carboxypeptidase-like regulatory domain-containing protein [Terracidiphilus sp.]